MKKIHNFYFPDWDNHFQDFFNLNKGYQEAQRNRALSFVEDFGVAIDCGAHVGLWSRDLSNFFDNLYCFEPVKEFFECLKLNIKSKNAKLYNLGLAEKKIEKEALITKSLGNSGASRPLLKEEKVSSKDYVQKIQMVNLDSFNLTKVDFIKIDVEGLGLQVLKGMANTLRVCNPVVCIELFEKVEKAEQMEFMHSIGYDLVDIIIKEHVFKKK
ncbi:FkbM family methyltransferase [Pelagibacteraceae bacterium]|nr:FkbM family methyltransferase [Pelagibacteraceae bacterium]